MSQTRFVPEPSEGAGRASNSPRTRSRKTCSRPTQSIRSIRRAQATALLWASAGWRQAEHQPSPKPKWSHRAPPGTSESAAAMIARKAPTMRERVFAAIQARGAYGLADHEGQAALGILMQTYTPRRGELASMGLIVDSGRRRKTPSGCRAAVWVSVEFAPKGANP